jgi:hypothetical protein
MPPLCNQADPFLLDEEEEVRPRRRSKTQIDRTTLPAAELEALRARERASQRRRLARKRAARTPGYAGLPVAAQRDVDRSFMGAEDSMHADTKHRRRSVATRTNITIGQVKHKHQSATIADRYYAEHFRAERIRETMQHARIGTD